MRIPESRAVRLGSVLAIFGQLALSPFALAADAAPVVPPRALAHATTAIEKATEGKVLEIRLADQRGAPGFEAAVKKGDDLVYMRIAAVSDDVTEIKVSELPAWLADYHLEGYMRGIDKAKVPLAQAIVQAEELAAAPAIGAGLAKPLSGTQPAVAYLVEMIKGDMRVVAAIDAQSGGFIKDAKSVYEPRRPVELARRLAEQ